LKSTSLDISSDVDIFWFDVLKSTSEDVARRLQCHYKNSLISIFNNLSINLTMIKHF